MNFACLVGALFFVFALYSGSDASPLEKGRRSITAGREDIFESLTAAEIMKALLHGEKLRFA